METSDEHRTDQDGPPAMTSARRRMRGAACSLRQEEREKRGRIINIYASWIGSTTEQRESTDREIERATYGNLTLGGFADGDETGAVRPGLDGEEGRVSIGTFQTSLQAPSCCACGEIPNSAWAKLGLWWPFLYRGVARLAIHAGDINCSQE